MGLLDSLFSVSSLGCSPPSLSRVDTDDVFRRIYELVKDKFAGIMSVIIVTVSVIQFGASIAICVKFLMINRQVQNMYMLKAPITVHLISSVVCDVLITLSMVIIFYHYKKGTAFTATKSLLNALIIYTIENGLITSAWAIANLVVFFLRTQDVINVAFRYVIGSLYAIVLITTLNRRKLKGISNNLSVFDADLEALSGSSSRAGRMEYPTARSPQFQLNVLRSGVGDLMTQPDITVLVSRETHDNEVMYGKR
ncbi:hypothetical protein EST38_g5627 [Candolleomyces aberdarensis]|uniref:DUF6534 domain-containing protein n=1 Tax=Candolleomyces aberdarensis TaxID=2316362 RepID=A0A4Q2DLU2_9AGAR|nr:hypothetical protein EST38_g5627 [Candolleomyces aberdarensis]